MSTFNVDDIIKRNRQILIRLIQALEKEPVSEADAEAIKAHKETLAELDAMERELSGDGPAEPESHS